MDSGQTDNGRTRAENVAQYGGFEEEREPQTITLTPTDEGYAHMAATFAAAVLGDVKQARQTDSAALLRSLIEIAFYLGHKSGGESVELRDAIMSRLPGGDR